MAGLKVSKAPALNPERLTRKRNALHKALQGVDTEHIRAYPTAMAEPRRVGPRRYLEDNPTAGSVRFGGRYINLKRLAEGEDMNHSYLSYILSGERTPTFKYATKIVEALGLCGLDELFDCIADRKAELKQRRRGAA